MLRTRALIFSAHAQRLSVFYGLTNRAGRSRSPEPRLGVPALPIPGTLKLPFVFAHQKVSTKVSEVSVTTIAAPLSVRRIYVASGHLVRAIRRPQRAVAEDHPTAIDRIGDGRPPTTYPDVAVGLGAAEQLR